GDSNAVSLLLGNGDGTFQAQTTFAGLNGPPSAVALVDWNGNGRLDLVEVVSGDVTFLTGKIGGFDSPYAIGFQSMVDFSSLAIADVNSDGRPDLVIGSGGQAPGFSIMAGDGSPRPAQRYSGSFAGGQGGEVAVGDINGDGRPEVLVTDVAG